VRALCNYANTTVVCSEMVQLTPDEMTPGRIYTNIVANQYLGVVLLIDSGNTDIESYETLTSRQTTVDHHDIGSLPVGFAVASTASIAIFTGFFNISQKQQQNIFLGGQKAVHTFMLFDYSNNTWTYVNLTGPTHARYNHQMLVANQVSIFKIKDLFIYLVTIRSWWNVRYNGTDDKHSGIYRVHCVEQLNEC
jgi:hypothetical protein